MLLMDDPMGSVIEPLLARTGELETVYDLELMQNSGRVKGYLLDEYSYS
jgi:hypothetical protein